MDSSIAKELSNLKSLGLYRSLKKQSDIEPNKAKINGSVVRIFANNDYLGLSHHPKIIEASVKATEKYGTSSSASRLITGNNELYEKLETSIKRFKKKESALVFPTGYMANLGVLSALIKQKDILFMDKLNHASLLDAYILSRAKIKRYKHCDVKQLEEMLKKSPSSSRKFIVTDSVFSMDGDIADLANLKALAKKYDCTLIIDDAHGTGVLSDNGSGAEEYLNTQVEVEVGTLSKAIGSLGGFVAASKEIIDFVLNKARPFIFTTALPPATLAASIKAIEVIQTEKWRQEKVLNYAKNIRNELKKSGFSVPKGITPIIPIMVGDEKLALEFSNKLLGKGFYIPAIRTPAVAKNKSRLRMTVNALHTEPQISEMLDALTESAKELDLIE